MNRSVTERNRRSIMRSFSKLFSAINFYANFQTQFEIPVDNYVVKNEHAVLLMNRPL